MKIASWNVNSIKARLERVTEWLEQSRVDVLLLQELKGEAFPHDEFEALGYRHRLVHGQKAYNGVALLSRHKLENELTGLPGDESDTHARFVGATVQGIEIYGLYLPNGNPMPGPKFDYKLAWMRRFHAFAKKALTREAPVVFGGDFNVIPTPLDAKHPEHWTKDALYSPEARANWQKLLNLGYVDALRALEPEAQVFTFWDYFRGAFTRNDGIRIDHFLLSPEAATRLRGCEVDKGPRGLERPSDHTPIIVTISN